MSSLQQSTKPVGFMPVDVRKLTAPAVPIASVGSSSTFMPVAIANGQSVLPPEIQKMIPDITKKIVSAQDIDNFGRDIMAASAQRSDQFLNTVSMVDTDEFYKPIADVYSIATSVNAKSIMTGSIKNRLPFVRRFMNFFVGVKARAVSQLSSVRGQLDLIVKEIVKNIDTMAKVKANLADIYVANMNDYFMLEAYIRAGEIVLRDKREEFRQFQELNKGSKDMMIVQQTVDKQRFVDKLDKTLEILRASQMACTQLAPQLRLDEDNAQARIDKLHQVINFVIPLWKRQCAAVISSLEIKRGAEFDNNVANTTNHMYKTQADIVSQNSISTAKTGERSIIDMESFEHVNQTLARTIGEVINIKEEGRKTRTENIGKYDSLKADTVKHVTQGGL